jgi:hypothetical protein
VALAPVLRLLLSYVLSFVYLGIYWNNHHHMLDTLSRVTRSIGSGIVVAPSDRPPLEGQGLAPTYAILFLIWLVPDRRIERMLRGHN